MTCEVPCMSYVALYVLSMHIVNSNSRSSSNHWKLNVSAGKVEQAETTVNKTGQHTDNTSATHQSNNTATDLQNITEDDGSQMRAQDRMMDILDSQLTLGRDWVVTSPDSGEDDWLEQRVGHSEGCHDKTCSQHSSNKSKSNKKKSKSLNCGKQVQSTIYDHLPGVSQRGSHPTSHLPEPEVARVFQTQASDQVDMGQLEVKLRQARVSVEKDPSLQKSQGAGIYNSIGNFWRIKGNPRLSVECFRKALYFTPEDPGVLLNLARVLFNLQFVEDALFLAQKSLHHHSIEDNAASDSADVSPSNRWQHHFALGEILRARGHTQDAAFHFRQTLEFHPHFPPALAHLRELEAGERGSSRHHEPTQLTLFIILFLVAGVLFGLLTSADPSGAHEGSQGSEGGKLQPRHFNRAMAMRSIKLGVNPRLCRLRRAANS